MTSLESFYKLIDEKIAIARAATPGRWKMWNAGAVIEIQDLADEMPIVKWAGFDDCRRSIRDHVAHGTHIAANDPDSTIRMLEAFRCCVQALELSLEGVAKALSNSKDKVEVEYRLTAVMPEIRNALAGIAELAR